MRHLLQEIIGSVLTVVVVGLALRGIMRGRERRGPADRPLRMTHPVSILVIGVVTAALFIALLLLSTVFFRNETSTWWVAAIFILFAAGGLWLVLTWAVERIDVSPTGLRRRTPIGRWQELEWSAIRTVDWAPAAKVFRLIGSDGTVVRVSAAMTGLEDFARVLLALAPATTMDDETRAVVEGCTRGELPPLL